MTRQMYGSATMDALVSNTGIPSGNPNLCLDFGNDGVCDFTYNASTTFPATISASGFTTALNNYLLTRNDVAWGSSINVPVRVRVDLASQALLTNLALTPSGAKTRFLRLPARAYSDLRLSLRFNQPGAPSGPLSFAVDVGADGSMDCSYNGTPNFPAIITCPNKPGDNITTPLNNYLSGRSGEVDVPVRIIPSPYLDTYLESVTATPTQKPDLSLAIADISFSNPTPVESENLTIQATVHNNGGLESPPATAAFFARAPGWGDWYLGSKLVGSIPAGGSIPISLDWSTLGFYGAVPVTVSLDPYRRIGETSETNNVISKTLTIKTRADLAVSSLDDPEADLVDTVTTTISLELDNLGQTEAAASVVALYDGNPDEGGVLIGETSLLAAADSHTPLNFSWTPANVGSHRLFAVADRDGAISEANKGNNLAWKDVVVGLKSPVLLDSGLAGSDPAYNDLKGYGYVDVGKPDVTAECGVSAAPENTVRRDPDGLVQYRFNHLVPTHFYHLDFTLYECDGAGRQEYVIVDGYTLAGPVDLGDGKVHRLSLLIDPALYVDRQLDIDVEASGINGAVVSEVNLHDVDYRYADAGNTSDLAYSAQRGFGWLDTSSIASVNWGRLPYQSVRVDQSDDSLSYRFDRLRADRKYKLHLTFWQHEGTPNLQKVYIDAIYANLTVNAGDYDVHKETISVPLSAYQFDGSIVVTVQRIGAYGAMINEISLEEETLEVSAVQTVNPTPYFSDVFGDVKVNVTPQNAGEAAPAGTLIQAYDPRGQLVGSSQVTVEGTYGYLRIYGADDTATPPIPGMLDNELVSFKVNGLPAVAKPSFYWADDHQIHRVDLYAGEINQQAILLLPGWNLVSFYYEPPSPVLANVLQSIFTRYDRVLSETGVFDTGLGDDFITLRELHSGQGYFLRTTGTTTINMLVDGIHQPADTPLELHKGWNWIGYLPTSAMPIAEALASVAGKYQLVHSLLYAYNPADTAHSTLHTMTPGEGYMIYMNEAAILTYPAGGSSPEVPRPGSVDTELKAMGIHTSPDFMTIYGSIQINGKPALAGAHIQVRTASGLLVGGAIIEQPGVLGYMHIFGDPAGEWGGPQEGSPLRFYVNGLPAALDRTLTWTANAMTSEVNLGSLQTSIYLPLISR